MDYYYELVRGVRDLLAADGLDAASVEVLTAERSASTSGEAISNIGVALRRVLALEMSLHTREAVAAALAEGERLWNEANC